jgi:hypothetical protein
VMGFMDLDHIIHSIFFYLVSFMFWKSYVI